MKDYNATHILVEIELLEYILKYMNNEGLNSITKDRIEWWVKWKKGIYDENTIKIK